MIRKIKFSVSTGLSAYVLYGSNDLNQWNNLTTNIGNIVDIQQYKYIKTYFDLLRASGTNSKITYEVIE